MFRGVSPAIPHRKENPMNDLMWLGVLAGLFLLTLAYARLCDDA